MIAWNDWYHVTGNTYGTWLPADDRGWRTRHARWQPGQHAPPTEQNRIHAAARHSMTHDAVRLSPAARILARDKFIEALQHHKIQVIIVAINDHHYHVLARFPDHTPRKWIGIAKKESARALSTTKLVPAGGTWAVRCHCLPIESRDHQLEVVQYIQSHAEEGAAIWFLGKRFDPPP